MAMFANELIQGRWVMWQDMEIPQISYFSKTERDLLQCQWAALFRADFTHFMHTSLGR